MVLEDGTCDCERNVSPTGNWGSKCVQNMKQLGLKKVCGKWVPKMFTDAHRETCISQRNSYFVFIYHDVSATSPEIYRHILTIIDMGSIHY
jgi:hypothetical protein